MRIIVYITSWENINKSIFANQLVMYDSLAETICLDNSLDEENTNELFELLKDIDLVNTSYVINDNKITFADTVNPYLTKEQLLIVSNDIIIAKEDILELQQVMTLNERYTFVVPRCSSALFSKFPGDVNTFNTFELIHDWLKEYLFTKTTIPCVDVRCVLINGKKLTGLSYGKTDDKMGTGFDNNYDEALCSLMSFSLEMNDYGYVTVCANHAYAYNASYKDNERDSKLLMNKYGASMRRENMKFENFFQSPMERFGTIIPTTKKKKLLYYLVCIGKTYNGTYMHCMGVLKGLIDKLPEDYELTVVCTNEMIEYHHLKEKFECKIIDINELKEVYDIGLCPFHIYQSELQRNFELHVLRMVFWPLDLITLRSSYLCEPYIVKMHENIANYADGLLYFSKSVKDDFNDYFCENKNLQMIPQKISYIMPNKIECDNTAVIELPFEDYYLVVGNTYKHKMIEQLLYTLWEDKRKFIVIAGTDTKLHGNVYLMKTGSLSEEHINYIYTHCKGLIFPSIYEGFGLPPVQVLNLGKYVIASDMDVNHELENLAFGFKDRIQYVNSIDEIPKVLDDIEKGGELKTLKEDATYNRTWDDVGIDCMKLLEEVLDRPIDVMKLKARHNELCIYNVKREFMY